jgi:transcriptional regulator with XRE-family HTH domain
MKPPRQQNNSGGEKESLAKETRFAAGDSVQPALSSGLAKQEFRRQLGVRIGSLRRDRRMSRARLARELGIDASRLGKWESGVHCPAPEYLASLAGLLDVTLEELLTGRQPRRAGFTPTQFDTLKRAALLLLEMLGIEPSGLSNEISRGEPHGEPD